VAVVAVQAIAANAVELVQPVASVISTSWPRSVIRRLVGREARIRRGRWGLWMRKARECVVKRVLLKVWKEKRIGGLVGLLAWICILILGVEWVVLWVDDRGDVRFV